MIRPDEIYSVFRGVTTVNDDQLLARIVSDPRILAGKPVIKGTRLSVDYILNLLGHNSTAEDILGEYQGLTREDIQACLLFASRALAETEFMPLMAESA